MNTLEKLQEIYSQRADGEFYNETFKRLEEGRRGEEKVNSSVIEPIAIPRYKIIQPSTQITNSTPGQFRNSITEEEVTKLDNIVFLNQQNTRSYFEEGDFSGNKLCQSFDGYRPAGEYLKSQGKTPISEQCAKRDEKGKIIFCCALARWRNQIGEIDDNGNRPPQCKASISFLGYSLETQMKFWIVFHGASLPQVKTFLRYVSYKRTELNKQKKIAEFRYFQTTLSLDLINSKKGKFYQIKFDSRNFIDNLEVQESIDRVYEENQETLLADPIQQGEVS